MTGTDFAKTWRLLHGAPLPDEAARLAPGAADEQAHWRPAGFLDAPNVFAAAVLAAQGGNLLPLWEPFVNLVPIEPLGNGDVLFAHVPLRPGPVPVVIWNHETDLIEEATAGDLGSLPRVDPSIPLRFTARARYLVRLFARGTFELESFLAFDHPPFGPTDAFFANVKAYPPTGLYVLWHLFFRREHELLERALAVAAESPARFVRDAAALVRELLGGRDELGTVRGLRALRDAVTPIVTDPRTREQALARQRRATVDRALASRSGPVRLVRSQAPAGGEAPRVRSRALPEAGTTLELRETERPPRACLVLAREGRALSSVDLVVPGVLPVPLTAERAFLPAGARSALVWRASDAASPRHPFDGSVTVLTAVGGRLVLAAAFELDVAHVEPGLVVRTHDGTGYAIEGLDAAAPAVDAMPPVPGARGEPPSEAPPPELDGARLELTKTSLRASRDGAMLWEEPLGEAYAMAVLPSRRMVAVHHLGHDFRPVVDVLYVHVTDRPVERGQGVCSWVSFPIDGRDVALRSSADTLYVDEGDGWRAVDARLLDEVPSWIRARGWR